MGKNNIPSIRRFVQRKRIVRTIGIDSDVLLCLIKDSTDFNLAKPRIFNRRNSLFVNYKVFSEVIGVLVYKYKLPEEEAVRKAFSFMRHNNIQLLKKIRTDQARVSIIFNALRNRREQFQSLAGDSDLRVIAIYKAHDIDCIVTRNKIHFRPFCNYLGMEVEGLMRNIDSLLQRAFGKRKKY